MQTEDATNACLRQLLSIFLTHLGMIDIYPKFQWRQDRRKPFHGSSRRHRPTVVTRFLASDGRSSRHFFNVVSEQRVRQFFDIFQRRQHHPSFPRFSAHPRAWTKMKWRSIPENRVIPEIRCSQHFRLAEPLGRGGREGRRSETPKVRCRQLRIALLERRESPDRTPRKPQASLIRMLHGQAHGAVTPEFGLPLNSLTARFIFLLDWPRAERARITTICCRKLRSIVQQPAPKTHRVQLCIKLREMYIREDVTRYSAVGLNESELYSH